jgi:predicted nucleic acid-binding protein
MAGLTVRLTDTSAWHRIRHPTVAALWQAHSLEDAIATTEPIRLEILYSARSSDEYDWISRRLDALRQLPCDRTALLRALEVQRSLAHRRPLHHRIPMDDLLIAAVAEIHGATVWHYDAHFDRIGEVTGQPMEWIAPRGSL